MAYTEQARPSHTAVRARRSVHYRRVHCHKPLRRRLSGVHKNSHGAWPVAHATCESAGMPYCDKQDDRNDMTASIHVISGPKTALLILIKAGYFCLGCVTPPV